MAFSSWIRRTLLRNPGSNESLNLSKQQIKQSHDEGEEEELGVSQQLIDFVRAFTPEAFKSFSLQDEEERSGCWVDGFPTTSDNVSEDLSQWQQRHATLVLSEVKEISQLRYMLCPRHLKEREFWRIYFSLVKSYVAEYELRAVRVAKLRKMAMENENGKHSGKGGHEVEMAETKQETSVLNQTPIED